jgi:hypothetical protein
MKKGCSGEEYFERCFRKERNAMAWLKTGVLELRGIRVGVANGNSPNIEVMRI